MAVAEQRPPETLPTDDQILITREFDAPQAPCLARRTPRPSW